MFSAAEKAEQGGRQRGVTGSRARTGVATRLPPDAGRALGLQPVGTYVSRRKKDLIVHDRRDFSRENLCTDSYVEVKI